MELPVSDILARMEIQGIRVDKERLVEMGVGIRSASKRNRTRNLRACWRRV